MTHSSAFLCITLLLALSPLSAQKPKLPQPDVIDVLEPAPANGPNLIVSKIIVHTVASNGIGYTVEITNTGNKDASLTGVTAQTTVYKQQNGTGQKLAAGPPFSFLNTVLGPGKSEQKVIKTSMHSTAVYNSLCVVIDQAKVLKETQEGDNDHCAALKAGTTMENMDLRPVKGPGDRDLLLSWKSEAPDVYYFKVKNDSPLKSKPTAAQVVITRNGQAPQIIEMATPAISPYRTAQLSFKYTGDICSSTVTVTCDFKNVHAEKDEANNTAQQKVLCEE